MKTWNVSVDMAFGAPRERASMEGALEDLLSALLEDHDIEGPATGLNTEAFVIMVILGFEADGYAEALRIGVTHVENAAHSAGFDNLAVERAEVSVDAELATVG